MYQVDPPVVNVDFSPTDDPYFYDYADRRTPKYSLEDEELWESEVDRGITDKTYKDWLSARRAVGGPHPSQVDFTPWVDDTPWEEYAVSPRH